MSGSHGDSLVQIKCKACGFEWEQRRLPRRCANCKAYLAVVGCEILSRSSGKVAVKKLDGAKTAEIAPEHAERPPIEPKIAPKPAPKPNPFYLV